MMRVTTNPWKLMDAMINDLNRATPAQTSGFASDVDVLETPDSVLVTVNLPGVKPENVELNLERNVLTLNAKLENTAPEGAKVLWRERPTGELKRAVRIPVRVTHDGINANLEHGVLTVRIPKAPEATAKRIEVSANAPIQS
jgi:HSP20 family protein